VQWLFHRQLQVRYHYMMQSAILYFSQQMSVIVLFYLPGKFKAVIIAYLANIYALLISASFSISNSNLSQNDGASVLVAVLSPATLYLWADIFFTLLFRQRLPTWPDYQTIKESHQGGDSKRVRDITWVS